MKTINLIMKRILVLGICCLYLQFGIAQKKLPSFGKVDKADLEMTDCDFDKGADAVKLIDVAKMYYDRGTAGVTLFKTMYEYRVRIKILKDKGLSYANVEIPYYSNNNDEKITNIDACTINLDESGKIKVTDVSKSSIYTKKYNKRASRLIIAFPEAKVGSVIEYRYRLERETFSQVKGWYFQDDIPTKYSEYEVAIPRLFTFTLQPTVVDSIEVKEKETEDVVNINNDAILFKILKQTFIMRNLPGVRNEPFMGAADDYKQRLDFILSAIDHGNNNVENIRTSWGDVVRDLNKDEDFGKQLLADLPGAGPIVAQAILIADQHERINFIYNTVRKKMACNDAQAIYTDGGITNAWQTSTGNIAEINFLLVNFLNRSGIKAYPILLSSRDHGLVNTSHHSLKQFNLVMAYMPTPTGFLVLDATDRVSHYKLTPQQIVNTKGLVIDKENGKWLDVINNTHKYEVLVALQGKIDEKGIMKGECSVNSMGYARKQRLDNM